MHMKKRIIITIIILLALIGIGFMPMTSYYDDGGTKETWSFFYTIMDYHIGILGGRDSYITGHEEYWFFDNWNLDVNEVYERKKAEYYRSIGKEDTAEWIEKTLEESKESKE